MKSFCHNSALRDIDRLGRAIDRNRETMKPKPTLAAFGVATMLIFSTGCASFAALTNDEAPTYDDAVTNAAKVLSPLDEMLDSVWGITQSPEEMVAAAEAQNSRRENFIAECMHEAGFDYVPNPGSITLTAGEPWRLDDREWVIQYGYGVMNAPAQSEIIQESPAADPNQAIRDSLSELELAAWDIALWGLPQESLPPGIVAADGEILDIDAFNENRGCNGKAWNAITDDGPSSLLATDQFLPLNDAIIAFREDFAQNPALVALDYEWSACLAEAGHPGFIRQDAAQNSISEQASDLWNELAHWDWSLGAPTPQNHPGMAELAEQEITLALVDLTCRETLDYQSRKQTIQRATEIQFIADHRSELDALVSAAAQWNS